MRLTSVTDYIIFPYCPEVIWKTKNNIVEPKLNLDNWRKLFQKRTSAVVLCQSSTCIGMHAPISRPGLIESFLSLSFLEVLNKLQPELKLMWQGRPEYQQLLSLQGLAKPFEVKFKNNYASPVFMDLNSGVYFNALYNYKYTLDLFYNQVRNTVMISKQILNNLPVAWTPAYIPQFRHLDGSQVDKWAKLNHFDLTKPFALFLPGRTGLSGFKKNFLDWNIAQVKSFAELAKKKGFQTLILTTPDNEAQFRGNEFYHLPFSLNTFLYLISLAGWFGANEVDYDLIALVKSQCKIFYSRRGYRMTNLKTNARYLKQSIKRLFRARTPIEAVEVLI